MERLRDSVGSFSEVTSWKKALQDTQGIVSFLSRDSVQLKQSQRQVPLLIQIALGLIKSRPLPAVLCLFPHSPCSEPSRPAGLSWGQGRNLWRSHSAFLALPFCSPAALVCSWTCLLSPDRKPLVCTRDSQGLHPSSSSPTDTTPRSCSLSSSADRAGCHLPRPPDALHAHLWGF